MSKISLIAKNLQFFSLAFAASLIFQNFSFAQNVNIQGSQRDAKLISVCSSNSGYFSPAKENDGQWIHWDDGENSSAVGNNHAINFHVASRWEPLDLEDYDGLYITKISFFPNYDDCVYTIKIWIGSEAEEVYSQEVTDFLTAEWNVVELVTPHQIDATEELWFGYNVDTQGGYPAGCDAGPEVAGKGNMVYFKDEWSELTAVSAELTFNWNLQAYVSETLPPPKHNVTFNVNMANAEGFNPDENKVFLTGSFTGWAEPGTEGSIEMEPESSSKSITPIYHESWEEYEDFTTELTPWVTYLINDDATWSVTDFDFPGEEEAFAFMVFNPSQTVPDISNNHPAYHGDKYLIAIQSMTVNDNKWLISPSISICDSCKLSFMAKSITATYGLERIRVLISTTGIDTTDFIQISEGEYLEVPTEWTQFSFDLSDFTGEEVNIAIQYVSHNAFIFMLDDFKVGVEIEEQEQIIYTTTLRVEEGVYQYKYFSDAFGEGWAGGEWEGEPNREVTVTDNVIKNDTWGLPESYFDAYIFSFGFDEGEDEYEIDGFIIKVWVAEGTDISALTPTMTISETATIDYQYPTVMDFSYPQEFVVTAQNGVISNIYVVYVRFTNVEQNILSAINVYPNPFSDNIFIANAESVNRVIITNLLGQVVMDIPMTDSQRTINTSNLGRGVYLIAFQASNGDRIIRKMVKN